MSYDGFCYLNVPAGRRSVEMVYISYDYDNVPVVKEVEIAFRKMDTETGKPAATFDAVKVPFAD